MEPPPPPTDDRNMFYTLYNVSRWCNSRNPRRYLASLENLLDDLSLLDTARRALFISESQSQMASSSPLSTSNDIGNNNIDTYTSTVGRENSHARFLCRFLWDHIDKWKTGEVAIADIQRSILAVIAPPSAETIQYRKHLSIPLLLHYSIGHPLIIRSSTNLQSLPSAYLLSHLMTSQNDNTTPVTAAVRIEMQRRLVEEDRVSKTLAPRMSDRQLIGFFRSYVDDTECATSNVIPLLYWNFESARLLQVAIPIMDPNMVQSVWNIANRDQQIFGPMNTPSLPNQTSSSTEILVIIPFLRSPYNFMVFQVPPFGMTVGQLVVDILATIQQYQQHWFATETPIDNYQLQQVRYCHKGNYFLVGEGDFYIQENEVFDEALDIEQDREDAIEQANNYDDYINDDNDNVDAMDVEND